MRAVVFCVGVLLLSAGFLGVGVVSDGPERSATPATERAQTPERPLTPSSSDYNVDVDRIEDLVHEMMNDRRRANGIDPLTRNESLDAVARYKSWHMARYDYFAHTGPNGTTHAQLRDRYGSDCAHTGQNIFAERWSMRYQDVHISLKNEGRVARSAVSGLMNSTGHRQNALSPNYDSQGIGVFVDENGTVFVTQELCG